MFAVAFVCLLSMLGACTGDARQVNPGIPAEVVSLEDDLEVTGEFRCREGRPGIDAPEIAVVASGGAVLNSRNDLLVGISFIVTVGGERFEEYRDVGAGPRLTHFYLHLRVPKGLTACKITLGDSGRLPPAGWKPCPASIAPAPVFIPPSLMPIPGEASVGRRCHLEPM